MLNTNLCNIELKNPLILSSGILGVSVALMNRVAENGAGAVTCKSIGPEEREGHANPTVVAVDDKTIYNAVGLPTPGYLNMDDEFKEWKNLKVPLIASIYGTTIEDYVNITKYLQKYKPSIIELNISCPNKDDGRAFCMNPSMTKELVENVKSVSKIPVMPKLSPTCDVKEISVVCEKSGADALCCFNTFGPETIRLKGMPVLAYGKGGVSGIINRKKVLKLVSKVRKNVKIPIVATGGITYGMDAYEILKAGADAIGIGSAVYFRGIDVFNKINNELKDIMMKKKIGSVDEI